MKVIFSERAYTSLLAETYEKIKTETGGIFLGYYENETYYVVESIDPGPNSIFEVAYFEYDQHYVNHLINKIARLYRKNLSLLGLWHRHPGSFDVFSGTDDGTNKTFAKLSSHGTISALVNIDPKFRLTVYHVDVPLSYKKIQYEVGNDLFPEGVLDLISCEDHINLINSYTNAEYVRGLRAKIEPSVTFDEILDYIKKAVDEYDAENYSDEIKSAHKSSGFLDEISDAVYDDLEYFTTELNLSLNVTLSRGYLCLFDRASDNGKKIYFSKIGSLNAFVFIIDNKVYLYKQGMIQRLLNEAKSENREGGFLSKLKKFFGFNRKGDDDDA